MGDPREFGLMASGVTYRSRPGGYAVIHDPARGIAVVRSPEGVFLPGGGQEPGESPGDAAVRETIEECGLVVRLGAEIGTAVEYSRLVDGTPVRKICTFFTAEVLGLRPASEPDHQLDWLEADEALIQLTHGSQRWALVRSRP